VNQLDGSKKRYRRNSPLPEDTTIRRVETLLTPGFLRFVGELLYGERWQTPLAQSLGDVRGKMLAPATIHRWSTGRRSIPDWVGDALAVILEKNQRDLDRRARIAGALAMRIRTALVRGGSAPMDWTDKERDPNLGSLH
jgi:hypothetical protein